MVNMKMSPKAAAEYASPVATSPGDAPAYPYGLMICLNDESLKKLGYTTPPAVGSELTVHAKVRVTSSGENEQQDGDKEARCELQITDMELRSPGADASALYANSKMNA